jgi:hypothetical protein
VRRRVLAAHDDVVDMLVHIDPEDDMRITSSTRLPDRAALLSHLGGILGEEELPDLQKVQLHYLGGRVEAEVFIGTATIPDFERLDRLERLLAVRLADDPYFRSIIINWIFAPK